jgi:serine/threonine protein kinase
VLRKLHRGTHSKVKLVKNESNETLYAAHIFKANQFQMFFNSEVQNLRHLNSNYCVRLIESSPNGVYIRKTGEEYQCMYFVVEFLPMGNVFDLASGPFPMSDRSIRFLAKRILTALQTLHESDFCHRTLSALNVLFDDDLNVKFSGLAYGEQISATRYNVITSKKYIALEVINNRQPYNGEFVDMFSFGVILFYMKLLKQPFFSINEADIHYNLFLRDKTKYWKNFSKLTTLDDSFCDLIGRLLGNVPENRGSVDIILQHEWLAKETNDLASVKEEIQKRRQDILERHKPERLRGKQNNLSSRLCRSDLGDSSSGSFDPIKLKPVYNIFLNRSNIIYSYLSPKDLLLKVSQYCLGNNMEIGQITDFLHFRGSCSIYQDLLVFKCIVYEIDEYTALETELMQGDYFDFHELLREIKSNIYSIRN